MAMDGEYDRGPTRLDEWYRIKWKIEISNDSQIIDHVAACLRQT